MDCWIIKKEDSYFFDSINLVSAEDCKENFASNRSLDWEYCEKKRYYCVVITIAVKHKA